MKKHSKYLASLLWVTMTLILSSCSSDNNNIEPETPTYDNPSGLENALGTGNVSVTFEMQ